MTTPVAPDRPANSKLKALTVALVAAAGVIGTLYATQPTRQTVQFCMLNAGTPTAQLALNVVGTDTVFVADSEALAKFDTLPGLILAAPCETVAGRDSTADSTAAGAP